MAQESAAGQVLVNAWSDLGNTGCTVHVEEQIPAGPPPTPQLLPSSTSLKPQ
jgi:hypothetical protein